MTVPVSPGPSDWVLSHDVVDSAGHPLSASQQDGLWRQLDAVPGQAARNAYFRAHGLQYQVVYQPAGRFWTFQIIEAALFIGLATALLGITIWRIRRAR